MVKIKIFGKHPETKKQIKKALRDFEYTEKKPDMIISYGGDGTLLRAEREHPGVPKALFRYSKTCKKCHSLPIQHAAELIKKGKYKIITQNKIEAKTGKTTLTGMNDIIIRNKLPTHALRFKLTINNKKLPEEYIGDGIVAATPFGSTAYYKSITQKQFSKGMGIAFNNSTIKQQPILLNEKDKITLQVTRGEAHLAADNNPKIITLKQGEKATIKISKKKARIIKF